MVVTDKILYSWNNILFRSVIKTNALKVNHMPFYFYGVNYEKHFTVQTYKLTFYRVPGNLINSCFE